MVRDNLAKSRTKLYPEVDLQGARSVWYINRLDLSRGNLKLRALLYNL